MKNHYSHYSTREREKAIFAIVMGIIAMVLAAWFAFAPVEKHTAPDQIFPMANQRITWEGAGYDGIRAR